MKKKIIFWTLVSLLSISAFLYLFIQYRAYSDRKTASEHVWDKMNDVAAGSIMSVDYLLTLYFHSHGRPAASTEELVQFIEAKFPTAQEKKDIQKFLKVKLTDPFSTDSAFMQIVPVYDRKTGKATGNLVMCAGADGRINLEEKLYTDNYASSMLFYNHENYISGAWDRLMPERVDFSFMEFLFGKKDFLFMYINYFDDITGKLKKFNIERASAIFKRSIKRNNGRVGEPGSVEEFQVVLSNVNSNSFKGYLLFDSTFSVEGTLITGPGNWIKPVSGDTVHMTGLFDSEDSLRKFIILKNCVSARL